MAYGISIHPDALAEIAALPKKIRRQIDQRITSLGADPRPAQAKQLQGDRYRGIWSLRCGDYRILYQIRDEVLLVIVVMVGDRKDVYERLERLMS